MAMAKVGPTPASVKWKVLSPAGPQRANHVACIIGNYFYIHGGIEKKFSISPLNNLFRMDVNGGIWEEIRDANSPSLSHHACVVLHNRYMLLIGGWDGKARASNVYAYDTEKERWIFPKTSGFPVGAGLSSHTATLGENGDILIIGREGSTRIQRRSGNAFILSGDIAKGSFKWTDWPMHVDSRSGHTAHIIGNQLYIFGGRCDKLFEIHRGFKSGQTDSALLSKLAAEVQCMRPMAKPPCGRKQHLSISGAGIIFIHGGETFDGRNREPVGEMYVVTTKPHIEWYQLKYAGLGRASHVYAALGDKIIFHGGEGAKGMIHSDSYILEVDL